MVCASAPPNSFKNVVNHFESVKKIEYVHFCYLLTLCNTIYLKPLEISWYICCFFLIMAMFLAFASLEATCLSYDNLFTKIALRCSLTLDLFMKNGENIKFLVDPF